MILVRGVFIKGLLAKSTSFGSLWNRYEALTDLPTRKTVAHPVLGDITLDCEVLMVAGNDLRIIVYTAAPGTSDAANLELLPLSRFDNPFHALPEWVL